MSLEDFTTDRSGSCPARLPPARSDISRLIFFNVENILGLQIAAKLSELHHVDLIDDRATLQAVLRSRINSFDAVLFGADLDDVIDVAQRIHSLDKSLPIIILSSAVNSAQLRAELKFSPFLGYEILMWPTTDIEGLPAVLTDAAQRRRQSKRYQEVTLAHAHVQLEVLPLLRADTAEYVGALLDHQPIGVLATNPDGKVLTLNEQARQILGVTEQEALTTSLFELFPSNQRDRLANLLSLAAKSNARLQPEVFEFRADRRSFFVEVTVASFSDRSAHRRVMLVLQEVTLRVQAEKQRTEAVLELQLISRVLRAFHAISIGDSERLSEKILRILHLGCEQFGLPIGILSRIENNSLKVLESVSDDWAFTPGSERPLDRTYCAVTINAVEPTGLESAGGTELREHPAYREHGLEAYLGIRINVDGALFGTLCFMSRTPRNSPFTEGERETIKLMSQWIGGAISRENVDAHMRKLSSAIEQIADPVVIADPNGVVEYVNPSFEALTGYTQAEVTGSRASFLRDEKLKAELGPAIGQGKSFDFVVTDHAKDGRLYHEQITISPLKNRIGEITHLIATGRDITALIAAREIESKRQAELTHVARLSTLGGMVSGLAHELNQPLCAIMTYAQTCLRKIEPGVPKLEALRHGLDQIVRQAERANDIFERIRNFSRKRGLRRQRVHIREAVESVLSFVQSELRHEQIKLELKFPSRANDVYADAVQVQQVLLNLVRNSIDALIPVDPKRRTIGITVRAHGPDHTEITVSDTGIGCPQHELDRLFETFFTTKEAGLGVGLSISQSIVEAHGGKLWLVETSSEGTSFSMTFPNWRKQHDATSAFKKKRTDRLRRRR